MLIKTGLVFLGVKTSSMHSNLSQ
uniref:Uncharacterized protein n=1 Tax=Zea mays TaxID=4577 RepID=C4J846_MAIZE|nr:unknown [Zea mays]